MAKKIVRKIKLQIPAGKANPSPPIGTILGAAGVNLQDFCSKFNDETKEKMGDILTTEIFLYEDRSFSFNIKTPPVTFLLKKALGIEKGSSLGLKETVATISKDKLKEIAEIKAPDLNAYHVEEAIRIVEGSAKNMGIKIEE